MGCAAGQVDELLEQCTSVVLRRATGCPMAAARVRGRHGVGVRPFRGACEMPCGAALGAWPHQRQLRPVPPINRLQVLRMGEAQAVNYTVAAFEGSTHYALEGTWLASQMHHNFPWLKMSESGASRWWMVVGGGGLQAGAPVAGFFPVSLLQAAPAPHARWQAGAQSAAAVPLTLCPPCAPSIMAAVVSMREPISQAISMVFHNLDSNRKLVRAGGEAPCLVG